MLFFFSESGIVEMKFASVPQKIAPETVMNLLAVEHSIASQAESSIQPANGKRIDYCCAIIQLSTTQQPANANSIQRSFD